MARILIAAGAAVLAFGISSPPSATARDAPSGTGAASAVERLDPALDALVSPDAEVDLVKGGFGFIEGPVWVQQGRDAVNRHPAVGDQQGSGGMGARRSEVARPSRNSWRPRVTLAVPRDADVGCGAIAAPAR